MSGVISRGVRAPIIREGDDIVKLTADAVEAAMADPKVQKFTAGCAIVKTIVVKDKLVNIIAKPSK